MHFVLSFDQIKSNVLVIYMWIIVLTNTCIQLRLTQKAYMHEQIYPL